MENKVIVYKIDQLIGARCSNCLTIGDWEYLAHPKQLPACNQCAKKSNVIKLSNFQYQVYAIASNAPLNNSYSLADVIANKLNANERQVQWAIRKIRQKGLYIPTRRDRSYQTAINDKGEKVSLSAHIYRVLTVINTPKMLLTPNYFKPIEKQFNISVHTVKYIVNELKKSGFDVPSRVDRSHNLKEEIKKVIAGKTYLNHQDIWSVIKEKSYCSRGACRQLVIEIKKEGAKIKPHCTQEDIIKVLGVPKTKKEIVEALPFYSKETIRKNLYKMNVRKLKDGKYKLLDKAG